jgi:DNA repair exonuclease SbcCD ATPase subunit
LHTSKFRDGRPGILQYGSMTLPVLVGIQRAQMILLSKQMIRRGSGTQTKPRLEELVDRRNKPARAHLDPASALVECSVRASPTLARLMRKCATLEAGGTSAHDALLASAGFRAGEIEALRAQAKQSEEELGQAQEREAQLQRTLDQSMETIAQRDKELKSIRQVLNATIETQKGGRQSIEALNRQVTELRLAIAAHEEELALRMPTNGLGEHALSALGVFRERLAQGEDIREAALGVAGYRSLDVDAAMANHDRQEMRAFEALLSRSSLRRRLVLRLLRDIRSSL